MKSLFKGLATTGILLLVMGFAVNSVQAAGWVDHKFEIELPDGTKKDIKGAKLHVFHQQHEDTGAAAFTNTCYYPEKPPENENSEWGAIGANIGGYHCSTPSSCTIIDYGAPFLPKDFNTNSDIYSQSNASYFSFYKISFTEDLKKLGFGTLAGTYQEGNIRGFDGAKWEGTVNFSEIDSKGPVAIVTDQAEIDRELNSRADWGKKGFDGATHRWGPREVYKDPQGGNALHGQITWVLKPPAVAEKPTALLAGGCATDDPGVPTYSYTLYEIDLKGQQFADSHLFLRVNKLSSITDEFKQQFGPPIYENAQYMDYSLIYNTTPPDAVNKIYHKILPTEGIGNKPENKKTLTDLVKWVDAKRKVGAILPPMQIATNLQSKSGDKTSMNDFIRDTKFVPKFETNECGTPATSPPPAGPMCTSITMLNTGGNIITDYSSIKPGDQVKFSCGRATGVTQYAFRVVKFTGNNVQDGDPISLQPETAGASISRTFAIPADGGKFLAQCAICPDGKCQAFEPASYTQRP